MKTKEQVLDYVREELTLNNTVVIATLGNGGAGLTEIISASSEQVEQFVKELESMDFSGVVEPSEDIQDHKFWNENCKSYEFTDGEGFREQIMIEEEVDLRD